MSLSGEKGEVGAALQSPAAGSMEKTGLPYLFSRCCSPAQHAPLTVLPSLYLRHIVHLHMVMGWSMAP